MEDDRLCRVLVGEGVNEYPLLNPRRSVGVDGEISLEGYAEVPGALKGIGSPVLSVGCEEDEVVIVWVSSSSFIRFGMEEDDVAEKEGCRIESVNRPLPKWTGRVVSCDGVDDDDDDGPTVLPLEAKLDISPNSLTSPSEETKVEPLPNVRLVGSEAREF